MGIINLTSHSFSTIGRMTHLNEAVAYARQLVAEGASVLDIGAEPTNRHSVQYPVSEADELARLIPVITAIRDELSTPISVDTSRPRVMDAAILAGADMINDVRALRMPGALEAALHLDVPIVLMHMRFLQDRVSGQVLEQTENPTQDIVAEVYTFLEKRIQSCLDAGIKATHLFIDPGIGAGSFGKSLDENVILLKHLSLFTQLNMPILVGTSQKLLWADRATISDEKRCLGSVLSALKAYSQGANLLRVHDVAAMSYALKIADSLAMIS